jgi:exo-beta-1,3-glucanase (GH17 family)
MRIAFGSFVAVVAAIIAFWWWLGLPAAMPASPLGAGERLPCVSYAPFRTQTRFGEFTPPATAATIEADLAVLSRIASCVRTYSTDLGVDQVPKIARRYGMTVLLGIWLGREPAGNKREVDTAVALANDHPDVVRMVIVGNEVLLRGELSPEALSAYIRDVKSRVKVPVTYADVWEFWLRYRQVADAVDLVTVHMLPYWEDVPITAAASVPHVDAVHAEVARGFPGKDIMIGEVGWPSAGRMREGALPSPANQARFMQEMMAAAKRGNYRLNVIEAFDQPWKRQMEGTVGGHWGLIAADGQTVKFDWGAPVSNHPQWRLQAGVGVVFAAMIFALAHAAGRRNPDGSLGNWAAVATIALAAGLTIGWTAENVSRESLGPFGWAVSLFTAGLAVLSPPAAAVALTRGVARPAFAALLGSAPPPDGWLARTVGALVLALCVIAVTLALGLTFDPRYRDFPFAPLTAAAIPWLVLAMRGPQPARGMAERCAAAVLLAAALFILWNEGIANWQSLWLCVVFLALSVTLFGVPGVRRQGS